MGYASISGRARTDVNNPRAFGVCDRCGMWYNHSDLQFQHDYRGRTLQNIRILVCETCLDTPQPQLKPRIIPPDPLPILNARLEPFAYDNQDERYTSNPMLTNVKLGTTRNITLSGLQAIDGVKTVAGDLVLVKNQDDTTKNGIYKASSANWVLQAFDNDTKTYYDALAAGIFYYGALGYYQGAVNVAQGAMQSATLFQINFLNPSATFAQGTTVSANIAYASEVDHYDFVTGLPMIGGDIRVTENNDIRATQETGAAPGSLNEIPGYSNIVPGAAEIGIPDAVPYGNATRQGLPSGFESLPFAGPLWPTLSSQSIENWTNYFGQPATWHNDEGITVTFGTQGAWPNPGPKAPLRIIGITTANYNWANNNGYVDSWVNNTSDVLDWINGVRAPICPPGGEILFLGNDNKSAMWYNNQDLNVNFGQIVPPTLPSDEY